MEGIERLCKASSPPKFDPYAERLAEGLGRPAWSLSDADSGNRRGFDRRPDGAVARSIGGERVARAYLCLRIGGNDLLNLLGIRQARGATVYDTPLRG